jgi:phytoene synthase
MSISSPPKSEFRLSRSYAYCERLARRQAANFYPAFRILPRRQRRSMCALYAFLRIADDLADADGPVETRRIALDDYRRDLDRALEARYAHPMHVALHRTVDTHGIPREYLDAVLDGVTQDLDPVAIDSFADLYRYCYRVASAVGLSCIHIWGFRDIRALEFAEKAGIAFQLTNILRDLGEDAARDRVYLPRKDLERFGYTVEQLRRGERNDPFRRLMRFQATRAHSYYEAARPLVPLLSPEGQAIYLIMERTYRGLLEEIERRDYDVFSSRVRLSTWWKVGLLLRSVPVRWGWA